MLDRLSRLYDGYVDTFRDASGALPVLMQLKLEHTGKVVENAGLIADGEAFRADVCRAALATALLHDTGRYEQLRLYNTFRDSESVDHAVFSRDIVREKGWLEAVGFNAKTAAAILDAVLYHNRRDVPEDLDDLTLACSHTVRDADKLDIFRVLEDRVENTDWRRDSRAFWNLRPDAPPSPKVVECIESRRTVDYQEIKTLADFVLIQVGWMISGLYYPVSRRICRERGHLEFRRRFLHELTDSAAVDRLCDMVQT